VRRTRTAFAALVLLVVTAQAAGGFMRDAAGAEPGYSVMAADSGATPAPLARPRPVSTTPT
jgi:hypothetical protein